MQKAEERIPAASAGAVS